MEEKQNIPHKNVKSLMYFLDCQSYILGVKFISQFPNLPNFLLTHEI